MLGLTLLDYTALAFFALMWAGYHVVIDRSQRDRRNLSSLMDLQRRRWMEEMSRREVRIVDTAIMGSLQNGTAFFASTSLLAIGGAATLLRATDDAQKIFADLPFGLATGRGLWELKVIGLGMIFGYAFFKFAWSYRLFNYTAILIGATPPASSTDETARTRAIERATAMNIAAGRHFTRGQRAFFFSFGYLGWFVSPLALMAMTATIAFIIARRQFDSDARAAMLFDAEPKT
jgi:uncharacterized membrane protein